MDLLLAGILLWSAVHYIPGLTPNFRATVIAKLGNAYRGVFSLLIVASIAMIVFGWRSMTPEYIYAPPEFAHTATLILMFLSIFLLGSAKGEANIKRYIRHPMLMGVITWGIAHLLSNGDNRSILLFGGMIIWATVEILVINKREGEWIVPEQVPLKHDIKKLVISSIVYTVLIFIHPYLSGVPVI